MIHIIYVYIVICSFSIGCEWRYNTLKENILNIIFTPFLLPYILIYNIFITSYEILFKNDYVFFIKSIYFKKIEIHNPNFIIRLEHRRKGKNVIHQYLCGKFINKYKLNEIK